MNLYINKDLAIEKGLISNDKISIYDKLENFYKYLFEKYLLTKVDLKKYYNMINESDLEFKPSINLVNPTLNDLNEYFNFNYIYLMNNFFIEKLSMEDINLLKVAMDNNTASKEVLEVIEKTYKDVIKNNFIGNKYSDDTYSIIYGKSTLDNSAPNDSIIFKIFYSVIDKNEDKDTFISRYTSIIEFMNNLKKDLKEEVESKLNINCTVLLEFK